MRWAKWAFVLFFSPIFLMPTWGVNGPNQDISDHGVSILPEFYVHSLSGSPVAFGAAFNNFISDNWALGPGFFLQPISLANNSDIQSFQFEYLIHSYYYPINTGFLYPFLVGQVGSYYRNPNGSPVEKGLKFRYGLGTNLRISRGRRYALHLKATLYGQTVFADFNRHDSNQDAVLISIALEYFFYRSRP